MMKIEVIVGNIVAQPDVEAVVNSANANLRLGSGVAGVVPWHGNIKHPALWSAALTPAQIASLYFVPAA